MVGENRQESEEEKIREFVNKQNTKEKENWEQCRAAVSLSSYPTAGNDFRTKTMCIM